MRESFARIQESFQLLWKEACAGPLKVCIFLSTIPFPPSPDAGGHLLPQLEESYNEVEKLTASDL